MKKFMHRFAANKGALLGLVILCLVILTALLCSVWYEESPWSMVAEPLLKPLSNADYPLGTDMLGRDVLSRMIYGARNTVGIALLTTILAFVLGTTLGLLAATLGGWFETLASRVVDVLMAVPSLIFALLVLTISGTSVIALVLVIAAIAAVAVLGTVLLTRGHSAMNAEWPVTTQVFANPAA